MQGIETGEVLQGEVLTPLKEIFVGKDEVLDLMGVCLVGGENLFILGPPGTAKSALVHQLSNGIHGNAFSYLLTRFTEPNELFGPFDIRKLRDGELSTNTEGMLTEASLVFLDELLNANSAILNNLLTVLNERVLRRGREVIPVQALMFLGASNHLPDEDALNALFDRFLMRVRCDYVPSESLNQVLEAGWRLDGNWEPSSKLGHDEIRKLQKLVPEVSLQEVRPVYVELIHRIRHAGIAVSDRRAVKLQRVIAASALLCGRGEAIVSDLWVLKYIWDREDQIEVLEALVNGVLEEETSDRKRHERSLTHEQVDTEALGRDLERLKVQISEGEIPERDFVYLKDRLGVLEGRCQWVEDEGQRSFLIERVTELWAQVESMALAGKQDG